jgi:hypothetical protein
MLKGDNPRIFIAETQKGFADIYPGAFTHEVQTIKTFARSNITGSFTLQLEGYQTDPIPYDTSAEFMKNYLEALPTVFTVNVVRETIDLQRRMYAWTVTFTHMRYESVQGAGNIPPMLAFYEKTLLPYGLSSVSVFEEVKGTTPLALKIDALDVGTYYHTRVTSYNNRGFSLKSHARVAKALNKVQPVTDVQTSVFSATELDVNWTYDEEVDYDVDKFIVEAYSGSPVYEIQTITTTSSSSLPEIQRVTIESDLDNMVGYYTLEFAGERTQNILWNSPADGTGSVALALASLSGIGKVNVVRTPSKKVILGLRVTATNSSTTLDVTQGDGSVLVRGDRIWVSGQELFVASTTASQIQLVWDDLNTVKKFAHNTVEEMRVYKWAHGYFWDISFLSQIGNLPELIAYKSNGFSGTNAVLKVDTLRHGVAPLSGTFRVSYDDAITQPLIYDISASDLKYNLENLRQIGSVDVNRFENGFGYDWRVTFLTELGERPILYINDAGLAGPYAFSMVWLFYLYVCLWFGWPYAFPMVWL